MTELAEQSRRAGEDRGFPRRILACVADSPRAAAVAAEAWRLARVAGGECLLLHAGPVLPRTMASMQRVAATAGVPPNTPIIVREGNPAEVVRDVGLAEGADMVVAGVLGRRTTLSGHLRSVAGRIASSAPCPVLLLTDPQRERPPFERFAVSVDFDALSRRLLTDVVAWGKSEGVRRWHILHEYDERGFYSPLNAAAPESQASRTRRLGEFIRGIDWRGLHVKRLCLPNRHGCDALWYAKAVRADVLCLPVSPRRASFWQRMLRFRIDIDVETLPSAILLYRDRETPSLDDPSASASAASVKLPPAA